MRIKRPTKRDVLMHIKRPTNARKATHYCNNTCKCVCVWERERERVSVFVYVCVAQALGGKPHAASIHIEACPVALSPDILRQVPSTFVSFGIHIYVPVFFTPSLPRESLRQVPNRNDATCANSIAWIMRVHARSKKKYVCMQEARLFQALFFSFATKSNTPSLICGKKASCGEG